MIVFIIDDGLMRVITDIRGGVTFFPQGPGSPILMKMWESLKIWSNSPSWVPKWMSRGVQILIRPYSRRIGSPSFRWLQLAWSYNDVLGHPPPGPWTPLIPPPLWPPTWSWLLVRFCLLTWFSAWILTLFRKNKKKMNYANFYKTLYK